MCSDLIPSQLYCLVVIFSSRFIEHAENKASCLESGTTFKHFVPPIAERKLSSSRAGRPEGQVRLQRLMSA